MFESYNIFTVLEVKGIQFLYGSYFAFSKLKSFLVLFHNLHCNWFLVQMINAMVNTAERTLAEFLYDFVPKTHRVTGSKYGVSFITFRDLLFLSELVSATWAEA